MDCDPIIVKLKYLEEIMWIIDIVKSYSSSYFWIEGLLSILQVSCVQVTYQVIDHGASHFIVATLIHLIKTKFNRTTISL